MESVGAGEGAATAEGQVRSRRRHLLALSAIGCGTVVIYALGLTRQYPLLAGLASPRAGWSKLLGPTPANLFMHVLVYLAVTVLYVLAQRVVSWLPQQGTKRQHWGLMLIIVAVWLGASLVLFGVAPRGESSDVFDYLFRGRMQVELGGNPLANVPYDFRGAPYYYFVSWNRFVDAYGPLWEVASGGVATVTRLWLHATGGWVSGLPTCPAGPTSCRMLVAYVTGYRLLAVALAGVVGALVYAVVRRDRPSDAGAALLAWLWNPLLLLATAVGAHNDMLMLVFWLAGFWALQHRRWLAALLALVLAAHVKLTALVLLPVFGLWLVRQIGWKRALGRGCVAGVLGVALSWLLYYPWGGWSTLPRMLRERSRFVANSPHHVFRQLLLDRDWEAGQIQRLTIYWPTIAAVVVILGLSLFMLGFLHRRKGGAPPTPHDAVLWSTATVVVLAYLLVGSFWFQPWYILWVIAPAVLLPRSPFTLGVLPWLCLGALWSNIAADYLPGLPGLTLTRTGQVALVLAITWLPALAAAGYTLWAQGRPRTNRRRRD